MRAMTTIKKFTLSNNMGKITLCVNNVIGFGGSCVVYEVTYYENDKIAHNGILKEYCPAFIDNANKPIRDNEGNLIIDADQKELFLSGVESFKKTYERISQYLISNRSATNYHTTQIGLFEGFNTVYTLTSLDYGTSFDKIAVENIFELMKIALSITKAVEMYHQAGFVHLDIKPQNIFILDEVSEIIKLFDFDSLTEIEKLKNGQVDYIPVPNEYYVPELNQMNIRNIGIQTDIFEIGALVFERIIGRTPSISDMKSESIIDFDSSIMLKTVSPKAKFEIEQLFRNTLQISKYNRYSNTEQLKQQIKKIIDLTEGDNPYLIDMPKWAPSKYAIGREVELSDLKQHLDTDGYVFIKGMGGLGKSELSKQFARKYSAEYHTIVFCKYSGSLKSVVVSLPVNGVNDAEYEDLEKLVKYKNQILHQSDTHTLLVIDNYNVTYDEYLREFLPSGNDSFRVIFTTRCEPAQEYYHDKVLFLEKLSKETCLQLFYLHSHLARTSENDIQLRTLIKTIQSNTLVLVLLAKAVSHSNLQLNDVIEKIDHSNMEEIDVTVFHEYDFSSIDGENYNRVFAHLNTIFNLNDLSSVQKELLLCLSLISNLGIDINRFIEDCQDNNFTEDVISFLISLGWIEQEQPGWIVLHPVISDLIFANKYIERTKSFDDLSYSIILECDAFGIEHIDTINKMFSYLYHLDKRIGSEKEFRAIDVKTNLAKVYYFLYQPKEAMKKYEEAEAISALSFRYKPRLCRIFQGKGEVESEFGNPQKAINIFEEAIRYCKKTVNYFYEECLLSIMGIAECYVKLHDYENAYKYYLDAYHYIYNDSLKDKLNSLIFVTNGNGTKSLKEYVPSLCDDLIFVCQELQLQREVDRFTAIKNSIHLDDNQFQSAMNKALEDLKKGKIKEGSRLFFEQLELVKEQFGEDSPAFKKLMSDSMPLYIMANADDSALSIHQLTESIEYIKNIYGEKSVEYLEFLESVISVLIEVGQLEFAKELSVNGKENAAALSMQDSYHYQSFNAFLIGILHLTGKTDLLQKYIDEIDYSHFQSKSELEFLIKMVGVALYSVGYKEKAVRVAETVYHIQNCETSSRFLACIILAWNDINSGNIRKAQQLLQESKDTIEFLTNGPIKDEYLYIYYITLAKCYSEKGDNLSATKTVDEYLSGLNDSSGFALTMLKCRALNEKSIYLRYLKEYGKAYESIYEALIIVQSNNIPELIQKAVYGNYAICSIHQELFEEGYDSIEKFMELYSVEQKIADMEYLNCIIFFIDALIVKHDKSFYYFIEEAEKVVEQGGFEKTFLNGMLQNYIGVVLADYEEEFGLAENHFNAAKQLLEELGETNNSLYSQIVANIDYVSEKTMDKLIKEMAQYYNGQEDNKDE